MLFRACVVQFCVGLVFLLFPMLTMTISLIYEPPFADYIYNVLLILSSMHSIAEYLAIMYFITPYRRFFVEIFNNSWDGNMSGRVSSLKVVGW